MILVTGGSGRLGTEIKKLFLKDMWFPTHEELDITKTIIPNRDVHLIIHCAAYTDVLKAEKEREECYKVNVKGTVNLIQAYEGIPFVFISTEYAFKPVNYYGVTKALAEREILLESNHILILRTLFKPRPYPFKRAFTDQYTMGDYVDIITPLLMVEVFKWNRKSQQMQYVGTGRKTIFQLAKQTVPDVQEASVHDITNVNIPEDYL